MKYSALTHPKVLKSILKKTKQLSTDNEDDSIPNDLINDTIQSDNKVNRQSDFKFYASAEGDNRHLMNGHLNYAFYDDKQDLTAHKQKDSGNNKVLQNGVGFQSQGDLHLHRVRVDIH